MGSYLRSRLVRGIADDISTLTSGLNVRFSEGLLRRWQRITQTAGFSNNEVHPQEGAVRFTARKRRIASLVRARKF